MPPTDSTSTEGRWPAQVAATFEKEWRTELRSKHGLWTASLFSALTLVAVSLAPFGETLSRGAAAVLLVIALLFSAVATLPRIFLGEDEAGTFDLLRLLADPGAAYTGKALFGVLTTVVSGLVLGGAFVVLMALPVPRPGLFGFALLVTCLASGFGISLCSALAVGAANRWVLAGALAVPILLPQVALSVGALRTSLGVGSAAIGWQAAMGLAGYALALAAAGPLLVGAVWRLERR